MWRRTLLPRGSVLLALFILSITGGCNLFSSAKAPREVASYDARTFFETVSVFGASFTADETAILYTSNLTGVLNVYRQPLSGGPVEQLTHSESDACVVVSCFPADERFLYTSDQGGDELNHLHVMERNGRPRDLTPGRELKASFAGWTRDGKSFFVNSNERDRRYFDLYRYRSDTYSREMVYRNEEGYSVSAVSGDGRWVALGKQRNNEDSDIYLYEIGGASELVHVTPHQGFVSHSVLDFTPDGGELIYLTNGHGEFDQAWAFDVRTDTHRRVLEADWDVSFVTFSHDGKYRISGINADARSVIRVEETGTGREIRFPRVGAGDIGGVTVSRSESKIAFSLNGDTSPSNLFWLDLDSGRYRRLTDTLNPAIDPGSLVEGRVIRYSSFDQLPIPALEYRPHAASEEHRVPALVWVHGGPGGQSRHGYNPTLQYLVNHGFAVLAVNNRGSSGYGKTFNHMDDRRHGEVDLQDCVYARKYLETLPWVDGDRIGIIGGSYGGYMVAAALAFEPDAFEVGIDIFGVTNWVRTLDSIPAWWSSFRDALYAEMGDPATDRERLERISPLFHAANIKKPLLVIQGRNDPRVLKAESDELVDAVRSGGVHVEYVLFDDEGHGFRKKENQITAAEAYVAFLDRFLKGGDQGKP